MQSAALAEAFLEQQDLLPRELELLPPRAVSCLRLAAAVADRFSADDFFVVIFFIN